MIELLRFVLTAPPEPAPAEDVAAFFARGGTIAARFALPLDAAVAGGFAADRLGFAFAAGYRAAVRALAPEVAGAGLTALCITEEAGGHPRAIATTLARDGERGLRLAGKKRWATLSPLADELLVAASIGTDEAGRNRLRLVRVARSAPGVRIETMPPAPFAPEIPHAEVTLDDVRVEEGQLLEGDGYERYVKPFRTIEDLHVHAAMLGYLAGVARRRGWPELVERIAAAIAAARAFAPEDRSDPALHVALAGLLDDAQRLADEIDARWSAVPSAERDRWVRDRALVRVAERARAARRARAWERLA